MIITFILGLGGENNFYSIDEYQLNILDEIKILFKIKSWQGINIIFDNIVYYQFTPLLFDKILKSENKIVNIIVIDLIELLELVNPLTWCQCKCDNSKIMPIIDDNPIEFLTVNLNIKAKLIIDKNIYRVNFEMLESIDIDSLDYFLDDRVNNVPLDMFKSLYNYNNEFSAKKDLIKVISIKKITK